MLQYNVMFVGLRGTSIGMLGVDKGVLVAADRRVGDTPSSAFSDDAKKLLLIHPYGLVTGWGTAALRDNKTGEVRVDRGPVKSG